MRRLTTLADVLRDMKTTTELPIRSSGFFRKGLRPSKVPLEVRKSFRDKNPRAQLLEFYPSLKDELNSENYKDHFQVSLWREQLQTELTWSAYAMKRIIHQNSEDSHYIEVPRLKEFHPSVIIGDRVRICNPLNSEEMFEGPIRNIIFDDEDLARILVQLPKKFNQNYDGSPCVVQFIPGRASFTRLHFAVKQTVQYRGPEWLFPVSIALREPWISYSEDEDVLQPAFQDKDMHGNSNGSVQTNKLKWYNHKLNEEQKNAVRNILMAKGRPLPYIIFGPPGTGKTITVVEAILQIYFMEPSSRILVTLPTNAAADLITDHLVATELFIPKDLVRLNGFLRNGEEVSSRIVDFCEDGEHLDKVAGTRLIICTVATAGQFFHLDLKKGEQFSHVFIDEAGYCTEPETLIPCVAAASYKKSQVILAGDPEQLGPVVMCGSNEVLEVSLLERLMNTKLYARDEEMYPGTTYNPAIITKLVKNYRAHPLLLKLPSQLFYSDELVSCAKREHTDDLLNLPFLPKKGVPLVFHGVDGICCRGVHSPSSFNEREALQVAEYVKLLRKNGVTNEDIGIITPYRKQVEKIHDLLKSVIPKDTLPLIASVDQFHGGERKVIIISTVRSYSRDVTQLMLPSLNFIFSRKRFNVSITRAKVMMIVIGNPIVLSQDTYWRQLLDYSIQLGAYTGCPLPNFADTRRDEIGGVNGQLCDFKSDDEEEFKKLEPFYKEIKGTEVSFKY